MTIRAGVLAVVVSLGVAAPLDAMAQGPQRPGPHGGAPARAAPHAAPARPAPHAAPAARPAPHVAPAARPAPAPQRPAFHAPAARPQPAVRAAPPPRAMPQQRAVAPRPMPHMARPPQAAPQRAARPQPGPQRAATPQQRAPASINRAARQEQRQQQRVQQQQQRVQQQAQPSANPRVLQREQRQERAQRAREDRQLRRLPPSQRAERRQEIQRAREQRATTRQQQNQPNAGAPTTARSTDPRALRRQQQVQQRQQQREERTLRAREDRQLRRLPASQRAERRQEIQRAREQRATTRQQQNQQNAGALAAARQAAREARGPRRNGQPRVTADQARQGRFAAAFNARAQARDPAARSWRVAAHRAWRHGRRAAFVGWFGPVFWPYAYSDIFDYTFWPGGYDDGYWYTAYDDFFDGVFWGEAGPPEDYVESYADAGPTGTAAIGASPGATPPRPTYSSVQELCKQPGSGVTAWPFADIEKKVGLDEDQKQLLADVRNAGQKAAAVFKASCPAENAFPLTPPGRLLAMTGRLQATLEAVRTVRPALDKFYASLSDEQKERFNEIGPKQQPQTAGDASQASAQEAQSCKDQKPGLSNLPIEKIEDVVKPTDAQETELDALQTATDKAVSIMQAACPEDTPITPPGRLEAMENRLQAMLDAANTVKPALDSFYASLTNEQKARFNRIGRELAQADQ